MKLNAPIRFKPVYQTYLWGGRTMAQRYYRDDAPATGPVAESWEVSDRADGMSVVTGGELDGASFRALMEEHRDEIMGPSITREVFPLLIKLIDARETLSVQVHPDDESASRGLGDAKSEAWYVIAAGPGACVYHGFMPGVTREAAELGFRDGTVAEMMRRISVSPGDIIYVPGGTVHAIGAGCLLLEVQQNSNTTYRLFDWNRTGPDGKPRPLHLEQARQVIHWETAEHHSPSEDGRCVTPYFSIEPRELGKRALSLADPLKGFTVVVVVDGPVLLQYPAGETIAPAGTTWLIPAALRKVKAVRHDSNPGKLVIVRGSRPG
jgi:mannose-6-phosphate isomerase